MVPRDGQTQKTPAQTRGIWFGPRNRRSLSNRYWNEASVHSLFAFRGANAGWTFLLIPKDYAVWDLADASPVEEMSSAPDCFSRSFALEISADVSQ